MKPQLPKLLTRDEFREAVFKRDDHKCVICNGEAKDAHHIMERRLFSDGGYYLDNGASLCWSHHLQAEMTLISPNELREKIGIKKVILPIHLYDDQEYDKWGNIILNDHTRLKGELFYDESVQKVLDQGNALEFFSDKVKYPRTHHLPWSPGMHDDDRMLSSTKVFDNKRVIVTEKLDGENTTLGYNYIHARSLDSQNHESRNWVKNFWSGISYDIPLGYRICGENMFATHSIKYENLDTYFYGFSIWNEKNICMSWDDTKFWFELFNIKPVPVLYDDIYDEQKIKDIWNRLDYNTNEGYVLRIADEFSMSDFKNVVGKFVREKHINSVKHWMHGQKMEVNKLKEISNV